MLGFLKNIFHPQPQAIVINNEFRIVPAFKWRGIKYYMFEEPVNLASGRAFTAMIFMHELSMRCNVDYLKNYVESVENILSEKRINVDNVKRLNQIFKERINFLMGLPDHVYKLASIVFFTRDESPFGYDEAYNKKHKIEPWSKDKNITNFFLQQTQLKDLVPFLSWPQGNSRTCLSVQENTNMMQQEAFQEFLSKRRLMKRNLN